MFQLMSKKPCLFRSFIDDTLSCLCKLRIDDASKMGTPTRHFHTHNNEANDETSCSPLLNDDRQKCQTVRLDHQ